MNSAQLALTAVQLVARRGGVTLTELARELQIPASTAHRVLTNCIATGYVQQEYAGGRYMAGPTLRDMALEMSWGVSVHNIVSPILSEVRDQLGLTTSISVLEGRSVRFASSLEGGRQHRLASRLGRVIPAHATAAGKAVLAFCTPADLVRRYPGRKLAPVTDRTIAEWDQLTRQLDTIRARGWAISIGESEPTINDIAVPVMTLNGDAAAAISVAAVAPHLCTRAEILEVLDPLIAAASRIQWTIRANDLAPHAPGSSEAG
ncbi:IclR family transcriptional regulator [Nocardia miyunensis]|uniref:IclR family transcriptional regulator n=1 Tax=Nocardia miyunensis TaxID=282684 RepID=UPI00082E7D9A|nr:IclR family transcriptional regulator [Nocardia miyunensis]